MRDRINGILIALLPIVAFLIIWEALARTGNISILLSSPAGVADAFIDLMSQRSANGYPLLMMHIAYSFYELLMGFAIAFLLGISLGMLAGRKAMVYRFIDPIITLFMPIPGIAWAPIFLIWFGFGAPTIIAVVVLVSFFPIFYNTASGVKSVDKKLIKAAEIMGADDWAIFLKVLIPGATANIVTGIKLAFAKGWRTVIAVEMIASTLWGLGFMIFDARDYLQPSIIFCGIIVLVVMYLIIENLILKQIENRTIVRWGMTREGSL